MLPDLFMLNNKPIQKSRLPQDRRGFSLVEVLVALTVTHELLQLRAGSEPINEGDTRARMRELMAKVDRALDESVRDVQG